MRTENLLDLVDARIGELLLKLKKPKEFFFY